MGDAVMIAHPQTSALNPQPQSPNFKPQTSNPERWTRLGLVGAMVRRGGLVQALFACGHVQTLEQVRADKFDHPLFLITYPYIALCMGACSAKGGWSLFSLSLSRIPALRKHTASA